MSSASSVGTELHPRSTACMFAQRCTPSRCLSQHKGQCLHCASDALLLAYCLSRNACCYKTTWMTRSQPPCPQRAVSTWHQPTPTANTRLPTSLPLPVPLPLPLPCLLPPPTPTPSSLAFNQLSGELPPQWGRMSKLQVLKINSNNLSGPIPKEWGSLKSLQTLTIFGNPGLSGCLPANLAGKGPSNKGFFQAPSGQLTQDAKQAASGTKITGFCKK